MALLSVCVEWYLDERHVRARALAQERRRIAADVHDLIMQDLSLALATARSIADDPQGSHQARQIVAAGERALAGAREVVEGLNLNDAKPVVEAVGTAVAAAARHAHVTFDPSGVPAGAQPDPVTKESLVHIAREAVTNATKHAKNGAIDVLLEYGEEWRLVVRDQGCGFDPEDPKQASGRPGMGFGLDSMRTHANVLGGRLRVHSSPDQGTIVEALLP
jgi:signal transduction histidine kinase